MKAPWSSLPALPAALGLVAGILIGSWLHYAWIVAGVMIVCFALLYLLKIHYPSFILLFTAVGILLLKAHEVYTPPSQLFDDEHVYSAYINSSKASDATDVYTITIDSINNQPYHEIRCRLIVITGYSPVPEGSRIRFKGRLKDIAIPPDIPHEIDYNRYLLAEGIVASCTINDVITVVAQPDAIHRIINSTREALYNAIVDSPISGDTASLFLAALLGDSTLLSQDIYDNYRSIGIVHILALSGLHVGIIVGFITFMLFPLRYWRRGKIVLSIITLLLVWSYTVIVGMSPSIVRAAVMVTVYILVSHIQYTHSPFNSLFLSVIFILCINPRWLMTPGFQLSVSAVASLLILNSLIPLSVQRCRKLYWCVMLIAVPVAAMAGTGIIGAYYFSCFPLLFLISNIYVGLLFPAFLVTGLILIITTLIGLDISWIGVIADFLYDIIQSGIGTIMSFSAPNIEGLYFSAWVMLPYFLFIIFTALAIKYRKTYLIISALAMCLLIPVTFIITRQDIPQTELFIPHTTGSGCIVVRSASKAWIFTDAKDRDNDISVKTELYRGFLLSRNCGQEFHVIDTCTIFNNKQLVLDYPYITVIDDDGVSPSASVCIIDKCLEVGKASNSVNYAFVCREFNGSVSDIINVYHPDTLLLSAGLHQKRRIKLINECADTVPYHDMRRIGVKIGR